MVPTVNGLDSTEDRKETAQMTSVYPSFLFHSYSDPHYKALLDSDRFENRAALARHLGVSRARVTQVLRRIGTR